MSLIINAMGYSLIQPPKQNNTYDDRVAVWPSRDPIEERGGINLYAFVGNEPVSRWDKLGLAAATVQIDGFCICPKQAVGNNQVRCHKGLLRAVGGAQVPGGVAQAIAAAKADALALLAFRCKKFACPQCEDDAEKRKKKLRWPCLPVALRVQVLGVVPNPQGPNIPAPNPPAPNVPAPNAPLPGIPNAGPQGPPNEDAPEPPPLDIPNEEEDFGDGF